MIRPLLLGFLSLWAVTGVLGQSVPFPTETPNSQNFVPWGYEDTSSTSKWDTSPFLPFRYLNASMRIMPPNEVTYDTETDTWSFSEPGKKYPLILFFHGAGENGTDNNNQLKHGGETHRNAVLGYDMEGNSIKWDTTVFDGFLLYAQQITHTKAKAILDKLIEILPIDINRIYVHGLSAGGQWTYEFAIDYPQMVAAMFPMSCIVTDSRREELMYTPIRVSQGSVDTNPKPARTQALKDGFDEDGGHMEYFLLEGVGHGTWNTMYAMNDFFTWFLQYKTNTIMVRYDRNEICPGDSINVDMGFTPGFDAYEWRKDGVLMEGDTSYKIIVNEFGVYTGRLKNQGEWTDWSDPVEVKEKDVTYTPDIEVDGLHSKVLPAPDGSTTVPLTLPDDYVSYEWTNTGTSSVVGTDQDYEASVGSYTAIVVEKNGCSSVPSDEFKVVDASGTNAPDDISGFVGYAKSQTSIYLTWSQNPSPTYNETGFEVYRSTSAEGSFELVAINDADINKYTDSGLTPSTTYFYKIRPVNENGAAAVSDVLELKTEVDEELPSTPYNLQVDGTTNEAVYLSWGESTDNVGVYRYDVFKNGVKILSTENTSIGVHSLTTGQTYNFLVRARDITGNLSPTSNQVTASAILSGLAYDYFETDSDDPYNVVADFASRVPNASGVVEDVSVEPRNQNEYVAFHWSGLINIPGAGEYTFYIKSDDGSILEIDGSTLDNDGLHSTSEESMTKEFSSVGRYPIDLWYFNKTGNSVTMVLSWASNDNGISKVSVPASAFENDGGIVLTPPAAPTELTATAVSYNQIDLTWTDNSSDETGFKIYRSTENLGDYVVVGTTTESSFSDKLVEPATTYFYQVEAISSQGESGFSDEVVEGVRYKYYQRVLSNLDDIDTYTPDANGVSSNFDVSVRERNNNFALVWEGGIYVPETGEYTFGLNVADGGKLFVDGTEVVDNDGPTNRSSAENVMGDITLDAGVHNIVVMYRQRFGTITMQAHYKGPSLNYVTIPNSVLGDAKANATTDPLPAAPVAPINFEIESASIASLQLTWEDISGDEDNFIVFRSVGEEDNFVKFQTLPADTQSFLDEGLFSNETYYYKVAAVNVGGGDTTVVVMGKTANSIPELSGIADVVVLYGNDINIEIYSEDADGDSITLIVDDLPGFLSFEDYGDGTGLISGSTNVYGVGSYYITVTAEDVNGGVDQALVMVYVTNQEPPTLSFGGGSSDITVSEGSTGSLTLTATSGFGAETLVWSEVGLPSFAVLTDNDDGTATVQFDPTYINAGVYNIDVTVTDMVGVVATEEIVLTVEDVDPSTRWYVNFVKSTSASSPWNNMSSNPLTSLVDSNGETTGVGVNFVQTPWITHYDGAVTGNNTGVYPDNVLQDYYFFGYYGVPSTIDVDVTGLDPEKTYNFTFFAGSDWTGVTNNGTTNYTIGTTTVSLAVQDNTSEVARIKAVTPDESGTIRFTMTKASGTAVGYLNAFVVESAYQDGTAPAAPSGVQGSFVASTVSITLDWTDVPFNEEAFEIYRSTEASGTYDLIATTDANTTTYSDEDVYGGLTYYYKLKATNSFGESDFSNIASVYTENLAPVITVNSEISIPVGETTEIAFSAEDLPDNDMTISVSGVPSFGSYVFDSETAGRVILNPTVDDSGDYSFTITAVDSKGEENVTTVSLTVEEPVLYKMLVNFTNNYTLAASPWNNLVTPTVGDSLVLLDDSGVDRGVVLDVLTDLTSQKGSDITTGDDSGVVPDKVLSVSLYFGIYAKPTTVSATVRGLDREKKYNFKFAASNSTTHFSTGGDNGYTTFTIGSASSTVHVQDNTDELAVIRNIVTSNDGEVTFTASKGLNSIVGFINGLIIEAVDMDPSEYTPSDLEALGGGESAVSLSWVDNCAVETGFEIYRATAEDGTYSKLDETGADVSTYSDESVSAGIVYYYKVRAILEGGGYTEFSNIANGGSVAFTIYVNANDDATYDAAAPWNNLSRVPSDGDVFYGFYDGDGQPTGIQMKMTTAFLNTNNYGMTSGVFPQEVLYSFYYSDPTDETVEIVLENLDQSYNYNIGFLGSYNTGVTASTRFIIGDEYADNEVTKNSTNVSWINNVVPSENSEITIQIDETPGSQWAIWNAMVISAYPVDRQDAIVSRKTSTMSAGTSEVRYGKSRPIVTMYPNPVSVPTMKVRTDDSSIGQFQYSIIDVMGREYAKGTVSNNDINAEFDVDVSSLKSAVYILDITYPDGTRLKKKFVRN